MSSRQPSKPLYEHQFHVDVKFTVRIPTLRDVLVRTVTIATNAQRRFGAPASIVKRQMTSLEILAVAMALALVLSSGNGTSANSPLADTQPFRDWYAALFLLAGTGALAYNGFVTHLTRTQEFYFRLAILGLAFIGSLGWGLLTSLSVIAFNGDWVRVAPWVFISHFFARACATYVDNVDPSAIEQMRARLPETPASSSP